MTQKMCQWNARETVRTTISRVVSPNKYIGLTSLSRSSYTVREDNMSLREDWSEPLEMFDLNGISRADERKKIDANFFC
jgi:hypothetical protein